MDAMDVTTSNRPPTTNGHQADVDKPLQMHIRALISQIAKLIAEEPPSKFHNLLECLDEAVKLLEEQARVYNELACDFFALQRKVTTVVSCELELD